MKGDGLERSYFDVLGICCSSEVPLIEKILKPLEGVHHVSVVVPTKTVFVLHDPALISQFQIVKVLNQARLEANVRVKGVQSYQNKWPSPYAVVCGVLLLLSFLKYVYAPFKWFALGAVAVGIIPMVLKSVASLRMLRIDINILMLIAVAGSIILKDYWEAGTIVFLLTVSQWLETRASHKATAVMSSLMSIAPQKAVLADTGKEVNTDEVMVNTRLAVKAGTMIPIDGVVVEGCCEVDEKTLTGESFPVSKQVDSIVLAGTLNLNGFISIKTTALAEDCVVAKMARLVEEAQNNKSKTQRYVDKIATYYTPAVCVVAACFAGIPAALRVHDVQEWYHLALVVLVSACPCAIILSTPVAAFCALSKAATSGLLVKGAEYLETLSTVKYICFDKTGTITKGEFSVSNFQPLIDNPMLLYWVSSLESKSSHPMAAALVDYARSRSVEPQPDNVEDFKDFPGEGICGRIDGNDVFIGNQKIAIRAGCSQVPSNASEGNSTGYIFVGSTPAGIFSLSDSCRLGVKKALEELKSMGIKTAMLTGDCEAAANYAQSQLGGALGVVHAGLLPQDKANIIKEFQKESKTAMVGDGLNDAPALATADIGISMGVSGSALANETGHIILMSNDIRKIPVAVRLARKTRRKIFENLSIAFITKGAIIALAIAGHPLVWAAVLADVGTCLLVIFNSMLLLQGSTMKTHLDTSQCLTKAKMREDNALELKHILVEKNKDNDGCCAYDDHLDDTNCCVQETKGGCCARDANTVNYAVQPLQETQSVHIIKHSVQETKCCGPAKETKCCESSKETKCDITPKKAKCCETPKELKCCDTAKESKCRITAKETKCCDTAKETKCCDTPKDTKSRITSKETKCCDTAKETKCVITAKETKCCDTAKKTTCCDATKETKCRDTAKDTKCCDAAKETKCGITPKETKCCDTPKELKCCDTAKKTKCCDTAKETKTLPSKETKCCDIAKESKCVITVKETKCCDTPKKTKCQNAAKETKCCITAKETKYCNDLTKDLEMQISVGSVNQDKPHCQSTVNMNNSAEVKDCCKPNQKDTLSEIVIE